MTYTKDLNLTAKLGGFIKEDIKKTDGSYLTKKYKLIEIAGKGTYSECWKVKIQGNNQQYAAKIIPKTQINERKLRIKNQIKYHRSSHHKNIVELHKVFEDDLNIYLIMQYCPNKTLEEMLKKRKKLTHQQTRFYLIQLINAISYLHNNNIIHRDVKLNNMMLDSHMNLKLGDFGFATKIQFQKDKKYSIVGTPNNIAPQVVCYIADKNCSQQGHSYEVDAWSVGIVMFTLLTGQYPFIGNNKSQIYQNVFKANYKFPSSFTNEYAKDLISKILVTDPSRRMTLQEILDHPYMNIRDGIPKYIPVTSLKMAPTFRIGEEMDETQFELSKTVAKMASQISIRNLRSDRTVSTYEKNSSRNITTKESSSRQMLVTSWPHFQAFQSKIKKNEKICESLNSTATDLTKKVSDTRQNIVYVRGFLKDNLIIYALSNGYIGNYSMKNQFLRILYNKTNDYYFQINGEQVKRIKSSTISNNQEISNIINSLQLLNHVEIPCQAYCPFNKIVYVNKCYEIKKTGQFLFMLSNGSNQLYNTKTSETLVISEKQNQVAFYKLDDFEQQSGKILKLSPPFDNLHIQALYERARAILKKISETIQKESIKNN